MINDLLMISPGNKAVEFIAHRIADDKYRGNVSIQHTVYDMDKIIILLKTLDKFAPNKQLMKIRTEDLSRRPANISDETVYANFVSDFSRQVDNDTQDTIRKNIFPDLHRMGLIDRYDKSKIKTNPYRQTPIAYVSITDQGLKLIKASPLDQRFIWSKALDLILGGLVDITLEILRDDDYRYENITKWEYMFFVSAVNLSDDFSFSITKDECIKLIKEFRHLSFFQIRQVIDVLRETMKPERYTGNKTNQRDFHNWRNKNDRIFERFSQTVYFQVGGKNKDREVCSLSTKKIVAKSGKIVEIRKRSLSEKINYYKNHEISKKIPGFELHHVVALSLSESPEQYDMFDKWQNMVYIDAFKHAQITQNRNRNVIMCTKFDDILLIDYRNNVVYLKNKKNIAYKPELQSVMTEYNKSLRATLSH